MADRHNQPLATGLIDYGCRTCWKRMDKHEHPMFCEIPRNKAQAQRRDFQVYQNDPVLIGADCCPEKHYGD
tara:strand:- start:450 stop:662 length:213 start_codon:yes stop_codon:yes gene_type:complete